MMSLIGCALACVLCHCCRVLCRGAALATVLAQVSHMARGLDGHTCLLSSQWCQCMLLDGQAMPMGMAGGARMDMHGYSSKHCYCVFLIAA